MLQKLINLSDVYLSNTYIMTEWVLQWLITNCLCSLQQKEGCCLLWKLERVMSTLQDCFKNESLPSFYHSDLRSRNDGQRGLLGQPVYHPDRSVPKFLCLRPIQPYLNYLLSLAWGTYCTRFSCWKSVFDGRPQYTTAQKSEESQDTENPGLLHSLPSSTEHTQLSDKEPFLSTHPAPTPHPITARPRYLR